MKYRKYIEKEDLNEGFFGDVYTIIKTGKKIAKLGEGLPKANKGDMEQFIKLVNEKLQKGLSIIQNAKMSDTAKEGMRTGFLGGLFGKLYDELDMSGDELQELFGWDKKLYVEMLRAKK